jgi:hypothetical protein
MRVQGDYLTVTSLSAFALPTEYIALLFVWAVPYHPCPSIMPKNFGRALGLRRMDADPRAALGVGRCVDRWESARVIMAVPVPSTVAIREPSPIALCVERRSSTIAAAVFGIGLLWPLAVVVLNCWTVTVLDSESAGYRYFHTLRQLYERESSYTFTPRGQLTTVALQQIQRVLTWTGYRADSLSPRINTFCSATIAIPHLVRVLLLSFCITHVCRYKCLSLMTIRDGFSKCTFGASQPNNLPHDLTRWQSTGRGW